MFSIHLSCRLNDLEIKRKLYYCRDNCVSLLVGPGSLELTLIGSVDMEKTCPRWEGNPPSQAHFRDRM